MDVDFYRPRHVNDIFRTCFVLRGIRQQDFSDKYHGNGICKLLLNFNRIYEVPDKYSQLYFYSLVKDILIFSDKTYHSLYAPYRQRNPTLISHSFKTFQSN